MGPGLYYYKIISALEMIGWLSELMKPLGHRGCLNHMWDDRMVKRANKTTRSQGPPKSHVSNSPGFPSAFNRRLSIENRSQGPPKSHVSNSPGFPSAFNRRLSIENKQTNKQTNTQIYILREINSDTQTSLSFCICKIVFQKTKMIQVPYTCKRFETRIND